MDTMRMQVYNARWQIIRASMLGTWTMLSSTVKNIEELQAYIDEAAAGSSEKAARLYRVINYMNAIRMGFHGQKMVGCYADEHVTEFRNKLQLIRDAMPADIQMPAIDTTKLRVEYESMYRENRAAFKDVHKDLKKRYTNASKRNRLNRPELEFMLDMLETIDKRYSYDMTKVKR